MNISFLPRDISNLICLFCWDAPFELCVERSEIVYEALSFRIPDFLIRQVRYDWRTFQIITGGLLKFDPYCKPSEFFREDVIFLILSLLDFRRKNVRLYGSRLQWLKRIVLDWRSVVDFSQFFFKLSAIWIIYGEEENFFYPVSFPIVYLFQFIWTGRRAARFGANFRSKSNGGLP